MLLWQRLEDGMLLSSQHRIVWRARDSPSLNWDLGRNPTCHVYLFANHGRSIPGSSLNTPVATSSNFWVGGPVALPKSAMLSPSMKTLRPFTAFSDTDGAMSSSSTSPRTAQD